jgi:hypothetical protein
MCVLRAYVRLRLTKSVKLADTDDRISGEEPLKLLVTTRRNGRWEVSEHGIRG